MRRQKKTKYVGRIERERRIMKRRAVSKALETMEYSEQLPIPRPRVDQDDEEDTSQDG